MDAIDWVSAFFYVAFVWISIDLAGYRTTKVRMPPLISNNRWIFAVVWTFLYILLSVLVVFEFLFIVPDTWWHIGFGILFLVNIVANKFWTPVFFQWKLILLAYALNLIMLFTNVIYIVFIFVVVLSGLGSWWLMFSVAINIIYSLWLLVALYLTWYSSV